MTSVSARSKPDDAFGPVSIDAQKHVPPVTLAGVYSFKTVKQAEKNRPIMNFLSQLADLFNVAPRLNLPDDQNFSAGRQHEPSGLKLGGGRPR